jgi:hypothetical protein
LFNNRNLASIEFGNKIQKDNYELQVESGSEREEIQESKQMDSESYEN